MTPLQSAPNALPNGDYAYRGFLIRPINGQFAYQNGGHGGYASSLRFACRMVDKIKGA